MRWRTQRYGHKHKAGIQANRCVFEYGLRRLPPPLYEVYNPMPDNAALS